MIFIRTTKCSSFFYLNNYILKQEDKDKLVEYLDKVDKNNNDYKTIQDLSVSLKDISTELSESKETIKILQSELYGVMDSRRALRFLKSFFMHHNICF